MTIAAVIVAAGRGVRAGGELPKQWQMLAGRPVLAHTLDSIRRVPGMGRIVVVIHPDDRARAKALGEGVILVDGGATRDASVRAGLGALEGDPPTFVLIHDAARPVLSPHVALRVLEALKTHPGAAPALAVTDALWRGTGAEVDGTMDRAGLFRAQTPQGFRYDAILAAHRATDEPAADDVEIARRAGLRVAIVEGDESNLKITTPGDFARARHHLEASMDIRTGNGFDVHRFGPGTSVWLCGIEVPHDRALQGHSDADVGMHAVTDAIYGALAEGDIGRHFPPSDPQWKGAASHIFLEHACTMAREKGYRITHVDCTLICEYPKIGPHAAEMIAEMARIMRLENGQVSVKATTSERLGFTGRGEGIASIATATLVKP